MLKYFIEYLGSASSNLPIETMISSKTFVEINYLAVTCFTRELEKITYRKKIIFNITCL